MRNNEIFNYEDQRLKEVIKIINKKIEKAKDNFSEQEHFIIGFKEGQRGTQFNRQAMMSLYATEINELTHLRSNPYFGRFEFQTENSNKKETIYIGKKAISKDKGELISYDWRSPICSMYYDYNIGNAEYEINNETKKGTILNKRQIIIKNSKLERVEEQDVLSDDQILLKYLSENADSRLKSIIATIQREQNRIIRSPLEKNYIIQGVAGSGKTTVALHRIAYLLYNEARKINETNFMILGPNKYFLNYISELLPDLDIKNVSQSTFDEIALNSIKSKIKLESKNETLENVISKKANENIIKYKNSIEYLKLIEKFINLYIINHLQEDIKYEDIVLCSKEKLTYLYNKTISSSKKSYSEKINDFSKQLIKQIKEDADDISHEIWLKYREEFLSLPKDSPKRKEILDITDKIQKELKKGCQTQIKNYFKFIKTNPLLIYQAFIENIDKLPIELPIDIKELKEYTLDKIKKKNIGSEDLSAILLINYLLNGVKDYENYTHLVIDEAQDLSIAQYYILKKIFPKCYFDIYGDVNQSIYDYQSIKNWNDLNNIIFNSKANLLELNKSYRITTEISNTSNLVLEKMNHNQTECVSRKGNNIKVYKNDKEYDITKILNQIEELLNKNYQTIAIICKDEAETDRIYKKINKLGININRISEKNEEYKGGICIMPSYLSKGLEFDAIILSNANDINYTLSDIDMKLLYVAITRAMHELYINYSGNITPSLDKQLNNNKIKKMTNY